MDPWGEPGVAPLTARVSAASLSEAAAALRDPALLTLLERPSACADANLSEKMLARVAGAEREGATGNCNDAPIQAARGAILTLTAAAFAGHSLISPPF